MKPNSTDIDLVDKIVTRTRLLCNHNHVPFKKLNLDYYEFEVVKKKVSNGICLYYTENAPGVQASKDIWYSKTLFPISSKVQNWQQGLPGYLKLLMGGNDWYKEEHHLRMIGQAKPSGFFGARLVQKDMPYALFFKFPRKTRVFNSSPHPIECFAEDDRLNLLLLLVAQSPEPQPRNLDICYDISGNR